VSYYSGYHQIALNPDNQDKTVFITPNDIYWYKVMTFSLKNVSATYLKAIHKSLASQIDKNMEAYIDDQVHRRCPLWTALGLHVRTLRHRS
jgi:hypothetical protein